MGVWDTRGGGNVHLDQILTNISVAWPNAGMAGPVLFPAVPVVRQSDKYYIFGHEAWGLEPGGDYRAPGTVANEIPGLNVSLDTYFAQEHALQIPVTDEERENIDNGLQPDRDGTELVTSKVLLAREIAMASLATTAANYASGYSTTLSGTAQWDQYGTSTPISDFKTGIRKIHSGLFLEPNVAVIPYRVMSLLEDHPTFITRIQYSMPGVLNEQLIASMLGIQRIVVPGVGYNSANPGQTASIGYLWGTDVVMAYVPDRPGLRIPAYGYEFVQAYNGSPQVVERWREEPRKSDIIRVARRYDLKLVAQNASGLEIAGYVIKSATS
jgi:hypothetical protein